MTHTTKVTKALGAIAVLPATAFSADLVISGVIDGPLSGGVPKAIEIFVNNDITDLSTCGLGSANNGSGATTQELTFDALPATAGEYIYVASESDGFTTFFGFAPDYTGSVASINGDDAIELFCNGAMIDVFGEIAVDGTGTAWEYTDGWAYRYSDTNADGETFVLANWYFSGTDALDGVTANSEAPNPFPTASFVEGDGSDGSGDDDSGDGSDNDSGSDDGDTSVETDGLIISEYIEGSSNNKAIELYNGTDSSADLADYSLVRYSNGGTSGTNITLSGTIAPGETFVIVHTSASDELLAYADMTTGSISHNGDDAYELQQSGTVVDSFGRVGEDPGSAWGSGDYSTANNTLRRLSSVTSGDTISDDEFDPASEWEGFGTDVFDGLGSASGTIDDTPTFEIGACGEEASYIHTVQGNSDDSALVSEDHAIEGIVIASFEDLGGFFVQEEDDDVDADATTSEGIFIYYQGDDALPEIGTLVRTGGTVSEYYNKTQITADSYLNCGEGSVSITEITLPFESENAKEALEGMAITSTSSLVVTNNYYLGRYGEVTLSTERLFNPTNQFLPGSDEAVELSDANELNRIVLDDVQSGSNPDPVIYPTGNLSAENTLRVGDTVSNLTGVMDYSYSEYRILPTDEPTFVNTNIRTEAPELDSGDITIASLNVLNLFNGDGEGTGFPTSRGADSASEYERQVAKTVSAILAINADVIGLMEIENDGFDETSAISDLVERLNAAAGEELYAFVDGGATVGTDEITVGILYKPETVALDGEVMINTDDTFHRPPMAQTFSVSTNKKSKSKNSKNNHSNKNKTESFTVIVNHFKSKSCSSASDLDEAQGDGQGCYNATRTLQSTTLADWINSDEGFLDQDNIVIMGDLNAYAKEDPIIALEEYGYTNLIAEVNGDSAYSYSYDGLVGYLDHMLVSESMLEAAIDAKDWHINADEPAILDYNEEYKSEGQISEFYSDDAYRMSDHDPVVATFSFCDDEKRKNKKWKQKSKKQKNNSKSNKKSSSNSKNRK